MGYFAGSDEVYSYIGGIFEDAMADPELGPRFAASGVLLKLTCTAPDAVMVIDMPAGKVLRGDETSGVVPTVQMSMASDVAHRFWLGTVNISIALAKGDMRAKGPMAKILKLVPLAKHVFPRYRARLEADGRTDLLEA